MLLATVIIISMVGVAGCTTTSDYTNSVGEPTNGTVIEELSITDVNELDGVLYELQYSRDSTANATYNVEVYELTSGSPELVSVSDLDESEPVHRNDVPPPWDAGEERTYELRVIEDASGEVVDSITFTIERQESWIP